MGKISDENRWKIVQMIQLGETQRQVAINLNIAQSTVNFIWKKYLRTGTVKNEIRTGRPPKLNDRQERILCRNSMKSPFRTAREVYDECNDLPNMSVCTVRRYLRKNGLFGRIGSKKPLLTKRQIRLRKSWCKSYSKLSKDDWKNYVFSDESRFEVHSTRRRYVRRQNGHKFQNQYTCKTVKYGGFAIMAWGAIKGDGSRILKQCPVRLDSTGYQSILDEGLLPLLKGDDIFMQDGAPCHRSKSTIGYLESQGVCYMADWPPQSPDLNIIENFWSIIKNKVYQSSPVSKDNLWEIVENEWYKIDNKVIFDLYSSIPRRIEAVLKNKGYSTKY